MGKSGVVIVSSRMFRSGQLVARGMIRRVALVSSSACMRVVIDVPWGLGSMALGKIAAKLLPSESARMSRRDDVRTGRDVVILLHERAEPRLWSGIAWNGKNLFVVCERLEGVLSPFGR